MGGFWILPVGVASSGRVCAQPAKQACFPQPIENRTIVKTIHNFYWFVGTVGIITNYFFIISQTDCTHDLPIMTLFKVIYCRNPTHLVSKNHKFLYHSSPLVIQYHNPPGPCPIPWYSFRRKIIRSPFNKYLISMYYIKLNISVLFARGWKLEFRRKDWIWSAKQGPREATKSRKFRHAGNLSGDRRWKHLFLWWLVRHICQTKVLKQSTGF